MNQETREKRKIALDFMYDLIPLVSDEKRRELVDNIAVLEKAESEEDKIVLETEKKEKVKKKVELQTVLDVLKTVGELFAAFAGVAVTKYIVDRSTSYQEEDVINNRCFNWVNPFNLLKKH